MRFHLHLSVIEKEFKNTEIYPLTARRLRLLRDATEKLILYTIYSTVKSTSVLYFVLICTQKGLFQTRSKVGDELRLLPT